LAVAVAARAPSLRPSAALLAAASGETGWAVGFVFALRGRGTSRQMRRVSRDLVHDRHAVRRLARAARRDDVTLVVVGLDVVDEVSRRASHGLAGDLAAVAA